MESVNSKFEIDNIIENNKISCVYFTGMDCGACEAIKFKINDLLKKYPKICGCEINGEEYPAECIKFDVYSMPVFLLFIEGKETLRIGRNVDLYDLEKKIQRYYKMIF